MEGCVALIGAAVEVAVVETEIFAAETFENEHDDVLLLHRSGIGCGTVDGVEDGVDLGLVLKPVGQGEVVLPDRADEAEGRVEHNACLGRLVAIVVGVADGDGADVACPSATHPCDAEGHEDEDGQQTCAQMHAPVETGGVATGGVVAEPEQQDDGGGEEQEVPVMQELDADDFTDVSFVAELVEHGRSRAAQGEGEIDRVGDVGDEGQCVHHDKEQPTRAMPAAPLLQMQRKEHHQHPQDVGVENGRGVEAETSQKHLPTVAHREAVGIERVVLGHKDNTGNEVGHIGEQQADHDGQHGLERQFQFLFHRCFIEE